VPREIVLQEERLHQISAEIKGLTAGSITIAAYSSIATHWLPQVIKSFEEEYPQIEIKLMEGIRQEVSKWLEDKLADVAFLSYKEPVLYDWIPLKEIRCSRFCPKCIRLQVRSRIRFKIAKMSVSSCQPSGATMMSSLCLNGTT